MWWNRTHVLVGCHPNTVHPVTCVPDYPVYTDMCYMPCYVMCVCDVPHDCNDNNCVTNYILLTVKIMIEVV